MRIPSLLFRLLLWLSWSRIRLQYGRPGFNPQVGKIPWRRERLPTPVFCPREFHGLYRPWGCKESDTTERLSHTHCLLSTMQSLIQITQDSPHREEFDKTSTLNVLESYLHLRFWHLTQAVKRGNLSCLSQSPMRLMWLKCFSSPS